MRKEFSILIILSALLGSGLTGFFLTRPGGASSVLSNQSAALGRFSGDLSAGQATVPPLPDGLFQISTDLAMAPVAESSGDILYYHADNGFVSRVDIQSRQSTLVSQSALPGLRDVVWSPDHQRVVTIFSSQRGRIFQYYSYQSREHGNLPANTSDAVFSPDSQHLALALTSGDESDIVIANTDGTDQQTLLKTHLPNISIFWQSANQLSFETKDDTGLASFYLLGGDGGLTKVVDGETGLKLAWSPDGAQLLYSTTESGLNIYAVATDSATAQNIQTTADQCAWAGSNIFCALQDNGNTKIVQFAPGQPAAAVASDLIISPQKIFLSADNNFLLILSAGDHSLYGLKLK